MSLTVRAASVASCFALAYHALLATAAPASTTDATSPTVPSAVLQSCAASMDGRLPSPTPSSFEFSGNVRRFYVAAEEVEWDYAPSGWDNWLGVPLAESPRAQAAGYLQYGTKWLKALYRGYTDDTFGEYSEQPTWQGTQGPTLRGEVGDLIEIMFVNKLTDYYATMHSMGLQYNKVGEGAAYPNNTEPGQNVILPTADAVPPVNVGVQPGDCAVYKWMIQPGAGPNGDEPARTHSYHSYVDFQSDSNAGLIGPTIVYAPGKMESTMANYREFPLLYMIYKEANSWLSGTNQARLSSGGEKREAQAGPDAQWQGRGHGQGHDGQRGHNGHGPPTNGATSAASSPSGSTSAPTSSASSADGQINISGNATVYNPQLANLMGANQFMGAPPFHSLNGFVFANNPPYEMCLNDPAIWYVNAYGSASHVFHMHGSSFVYHGFDEYAISMNDGEGKTLYMDAVNPGIWQLVCHVAGHQNKGMLSNYRVYYEGQCPLTPLGS